MSIEKVRTPISEIDDPATRLQAVCDEIPRVRQFKTQVAGKLQRVSKRLAAAPRDISTSKAWGLLLSIPATLAGDVACWAITIPYTFTSVSMRQALLLAPLLAIGIAALVHAPSSFLLEDEDRYARTRRRFRWALAGAWAFLGVTFVLFVIERWASPEMASYLWPVADWTLPALTIALPMVAGVSSAASAYFLQRRFLSWRERRLNTRLDGLTSFEEWLHTEKVKLEMPTPPRDPVTPGGANTGMRVDNLTVPLILVFLLLPSIRVSTTEAATPGSCAIWVDPTASADNEARVLATDFIRRTFDDLVTAFGCEEILIGQLGGNIRWARHVWLTIVPEPAERNCNLVEPAVPEGIRGFYVTHFRGFRERSRLDAVEVCIKEDRLERAEILRARARFVNNLDEALGVDEPRTDVGTDIVAVMVNIIENKPSVGIIVTDGVETPEKQISHMDIPENVSMVMILLPATPEYGGPQESLSAAEAWKTSLKGLEVLTYRELSPGIWSRLAGPHRSQ